MTPPPPPPRDETVAELMRRLWVLLCRVVARLTADGEAAAAAKRNRDTADHLDMTIRELLDR